VVAEGNARVTAATGGPRFLNTRVDSLNWTAGGKLTGISEVFIHPDFNEQ
jgi:hypothetical protein